MHSATTGVGEARPSEIAKHSATAADPTVAKSVGDGEDRPPGIALFMATAKSELAKPSGEFMMKLGLPHPPG